MNFNDYQFLFIPIGTKRAKVKPDTVNHVYHFIIFATLYSTTELSIVLET